MHLDSVFVGRPQLLRDKAGEWESAIFRAPVWEPIWLGWRGLDGDEVADKVNHGRPGQAVCVHPLEHYDFWNKRYPSTDPRFGPGRVGENWTLALGNEKTVGIGDIVAIIRQSSGDRTSFTLLKTRA